MYWQPHDRSFFCFATYNSKLILDKNKMKTGFKQKTGLFFKLCSNVKTKSLKVIFRTILGIDYIIIYKTFDKN